jgi:hypothetical protein
MAGRGGSVAARGAGPDGPIVGRDALLGALVAGAAEAAAGRGSVVLLT